MPKQPSKRVHYRKGASPPPSYQGPEEFPAALKVPSNPPDATGPTGGATSSTANTAASGAADRLETDDKQRLLRSPLLPEQLNFVPPALAIRSLGLGVLLLAYLGTLLVEAAPFDWLKAGIFSGCMAVIGLA